MLVTWWQLFYFKILSHLIQKSNQYERVYYKIHTKKKIIIKTCFGYFSVPFSGSHDVLILWKFDYYQQEYVHQCSATNIQVQLINLDLARGCLSEIKCLFCLMVFIYIYIYICIMDSYILSLKLSQATSHIRQLNSEQTVFQEPSLSSVISFH